MNNYRLLVSACDSDSQQYESTWRFSNPYPVSDVEYSAESVTIVLPSNQIVTIQFSDLYVICVCKARHIVTFRLNTNNYPLLVSLPTAIPNIVSFALMFVDNPGALWLF
jgi:hypothetical protein